MARDPIIDNTWENALREIRRRKFRRLFDPFVDLEEDIEYDRPLTFFRVRVRPVLEAKAEQEKGKPPFRSRPTFSLPVGAGRGRPTSSTGVRIPHTRLAVGGRASDKGTASAVTLDRYNRRHQEVEREPAVAIEGDRYLNRLERDALEGGVPSALRTNMDPDAQVREREWTARTRNERKAREPRINVRSELDPGLCARIAADPDCPTELRNAISRDLARLRDGAARPTSKSAGEPWIDPDAADVFNQLCLRHGLEERDKQGAVTLGKPRAGRVFSKWVAELPRELDEHGRQRYLDDMAHDLDRRGLAFVLVMHRPDPLNDPRNYHVHLMYSDRPVKRLDDGTYDIEQTTTRDYGRGRSKVVHQRQPKLREFSSRGWSQQLRQLHVDHCNRQLALADARGRYHAGKASDVGIELIEHQRKLGARAARIEAAGVGTIIGVDNALIEWERVDARRRARHERKLARIANIRKARQLRGEEPQPAIDDWYEAASRAEYTRAAIEEVSDVVEMATSRCRETMAKAMTIADTLNDGWERAGWIERSREADEALTRIEADLAAESRLLERLNADLNRQRVTRDAARAAFIGSMVTAPQLAHTIADPPETSPSVAHRFIDRHERRGVAVEREGARYNYCADVVAEARIALSAFENLAVQERLRRLHLRQQDEIARVARLAAARGCAIISDRDPEYIRDLIVRWRDHRRVTAAIRNRRGQRLLWRALMERDEPEFYRAEGLRQELPQRAPEGSDLPSAQNMAGTFNAPITLGPALSGVKPVSRVSPAPQASPDGSQQQDDEAFARNVRLDIASTDTRPTMIEELNDSKRPVDQSATRPTSLADRLSIGDADRVAHLHALDPYVADYRHEDGHLEVEYQALKAIGVGWDWLRAPGVQQALRSIRDSQQTIVADLARAATARPLAFAKTASRFWPNDRAIVNRHRLDSWADDPGFDQETFDIRTTIARAHAEQDANRRAPDLERALPVTAPDLFPDGFGGQREGPAPVFSDDRSYVRVAAFDAKQNTPTNQLLMLLTLAGRHPRSIELATDNLPMASPGGPTILPALLHPWRNDQRVVALVTETVRASRAAGRPIWPPDVAAAVRSHADRYADPRSPAPRHPRPDLDPGVTR